MRKGNERPGRPDNSPPVYVDVARPPTTRPPTTNPPPPADPADPAVLADLSDPAYRGPQPFRFEVGADVGAEDSFGRSSAGPRRTEPGAVHSERLRARFLATSEDSS